MTASQQPPPVVVVNNKTTVGTWILVAVFAGPPLLICGCCGLVSLIGGMGAIANP